MTNEQTWSEEGRAMCALFQGALLTQATELVNRDDSFLRKPVKVEQPMIDGNYAPYFLIKLASGIVLRVAVTQENV